MRARRLTVPQRKLLMLFATAPPSTWFCNVMGAELRVARRLEELDLVETDDDDGARLTPKGRTMMLALAMELLK